MVKRHKDIVESYLELYFNEECVIEFVDEEIPYGYLSSGLKIEVCSSIIKKYLTDYNFNINFVVIP